MMRLHRTTRARRVAPVAWRGAPAPGKTGPQGRPGERTLLLKKMILGALIDRPDGLSVSVLAAEIGTGPDRTRNLLYELDAEGLVSSFREHGRVREMRWIAQV